MTADERIEGLLNAFGQTIADLPKARDYSAYGDRDKLLNQMRSAGEAAESWYDPESPDDYEEAYTAYICHLADVIDRMETALETAVRWSSCFTCARFVKEFPNCKAEYWVGCFNMSDSCFIDDDVEVKDEDS